MKPHGMGNVRDFASIVITSMYIMWRMEVVTTTNKLYGGVITMVCDECGGDMVIIGISDDEEGIILGCSNCGMFREEYDASLEEMMKAVLYSRKEDKCSLPN